jgi:hypothetical protein
MANLLNCKPVLIAGAGRLYFLAPFHDKTVENESHCIVGMFVRVPCPSWPETSLEHPELNICVTIAKMSCVPAQMKTYSLYSIRKWVRRSHGNLACSCVASVGAGRIHGKTLHQHCTGEHPAARVFYSTASRSQAAVGKYKAT